MAEDNKYNPIKKYVFPAGECGGEIRVNIPIFASKEEVATMAAEMAVIAQRWQEKE